MKKLLFSYSLFGNDPRYIQGARAQVLWVHQHFPDANLVFYSNQEHFAGTARSKYPEIYNIVNTPRRFPEVQDPRMWRYLALDDEETRYDFTHVCFRDCDSVMNLKEAEAIREWMRLGSRFHVMRDHPSHTAPIVGGLWGAKRMPRMHVAYQIAQWQQQGEWNQTPGKGEHERFLAEVLWPVINKNMLHHGTHFHRDRYPDMIKFPTDREDFDAFVGEHAGPDGGPNPEERKVRQHGKEEKEGY